MYDFWPVAVVLGTVAVVLAFVSFLVFSVVSAAHVDHAYSCTVTEKDRTKGDNGSDARVYTENCGVFQVADSMFEGHWSSADTYSSIKVGETYDFKTRGYRVPFLSAFPNIVEVEKSNG